MSIWTALRSFGSPKSSLAASDLSTEALLLQELEIVRSCCDVLEHYHSIVVSESDLPYGKRRTRQAIETLLEALRHDGSRAILAKLRSRYAQGAESAAFEDSLKALKFSLSHEPDSAIADVDKLLALDPIARAAKAHHISALQGDAESQYQCGFQVAPGQQ